MSVSGESALLSSFHMGMSGNISPHPMFEAFSLGMTPFTKKGRWRCTQVLSFLHWLRLDLVDLPTLSSP